MLRPSPLTRAPRRGRVARASKPLTPEGATLKAIRQACALRSVPAYRIGVGAFKVEGRFVKMSDAGLPDLVLLTARGVVFVEVKSPRGTLTPEQRTFRDACQKRKIHHIVARSVDDVLPWVRDHNPDCRDCRRESRVALENT